MTTIIGMPLVAHTMEKGTIVHWFKHEGEIVSHDEPLVKIEGDQVVLTIHAPVSGILLEVIAPAGLEVPVGEAIGLVGSPEDLSASPDGNICGEAALAMPLRPGEQAAKQMPERGRLDLTREQLVDLYRKMITIRLFEEGVWKVYSQGLMPGLAHLYTGQEAIAVGVCAALRPDDYVTSTHRGHGHCIAKGGDVDRMMAELMGKATGYCKGKGGSMHIADPDLGILGANGIVGGGFGIATGAGLSAKMCSQDRVAVCFFGDGAANEGIFHEAINIAAIWNLPVIYVCENNRFGMSVAQSRAMKLKQVADRASAYGIPGAVADGNDVLAVYEATKKAVQRARQGDGPTLLEYMSYRWYGHHVGDPGSDYRTAEEVNAWKQRCPIRRFRAWLVQQGCLSQAEADAIEAEKEQEIENAIEFGKSSPYPHVTELTTDVFSETGLGR